jgi:RHS repeat-associated protein
MKKLFAFLAIAASTAASAQTVANDGSLNYTYAFSLPQARGKFQPSLALSYNSAGGATSFGVGWELNVNYIEASTRTPLDNNGNVRIRYTLVNGGGARRLVQVAGGSFRADTSSAYLSVSQTTTGWLATDGMGVQYTYSCVGGSSCDRWYLTQATDLDQNRTLFVYVPETQSCTVPGMVAGARLAAIHYDYNGTTASAPFVHDVVLTYAASTDQTEEAIGHCMVLHDSVPIRISVYRFAPTQTLAGGWDLSYSSSPDTHRYRLDSIQAKDRTDTAFEAPTTFQYETDISYASDTGLPKMGQFDTPGTSFSLDFSKHIELATITGSQCLNWGDCGNQLTVEDTAVFMDMDGDGKPDVVWGGIDGPTTRCPTCPGPGASGIRWARNQTIGDGAPSFAPVEIIDGSQLWAGFISTANVDGSESSSPLPDDHRHRAQIRHARRPVAPTTQPAFPNDPDDLGTQSLVMDFDGDGAPDLISVGCPGQPNGLSVYFSRWDSQTGRRFFATPAVCVDASAPAAKMSQLHRIGLSLEYTSVDAATDTCEGRPTFTWVTLGDFNGDGIPDFIVADATPVSAGVNPTGWHVYLGYKLPGQNTGWAFTSEAQSVTVHPQAPYASPRGSVFPIRAVLDTAGPGILGKEPCLSRAYPHDYLIGGRVTVDFRDMNGDGLPDRVLGAITTDVNGAHTNWLVDYNTGTDFTRVPGPFGLGIYELNSPILQRYVGTPDTAMVDLNRDGRPDLIARSSVWGVTTIVQSTPQGGLDTMRLWFNSAAGLRVTTSQEMVVDNPTNLTTLHPYSTLSTPRDPQGQPPPVFNEGFYDLNGDGIVDYVRALRPTESSVPTWVFHRGRHQQRRSDILQKAITPLGLIRSYAWAPSSAYDSRPGIPYVSDVVASMTQTGIAMAPLTVTYSYATLQTVPAPDDPTGAHQEALAFLQQTQTPSVGGLVTQTTFGSTHETRGIAVATCTGTDASPCSATTAPGQIERQETTWNTTSAGTCTEVGCQNPVFLYAAFQRRFRPEMGGPTGRCLAGDSQSIGAISCQQTSAPDAFGNNGSATSVGDALSPSATTISVTRSFATNGTSKCPNCMTEEVVAATGSTDELAHTYFHYDQSPARGNQTMPFGHLTSVESLVSGSGPQGIYESPQTMFFTPSGNVDRIVRNYADAHANIASVTEQMSYDPIDDYCLIKRVLSDNLGNELDTTYAYDAVGNLTQVNGPSVPGSTVPAQVFARGYDNAGRVVVESDQPIVSGNVTSALRAFAYVQPAAAQDPPLPYIVQTYSYAVRKAFTLPAAPPSDGDTTIGQQFVDSLGRTIETMSSFGSTTRASAGSNVTKPTNGNRVTSAVMLDGLGRAVASFDPFFTPNNGFVDLPGKGESNITGVHATAIGYDEQSRPVCTVYEPVTSGVVTAAPSSSDPALCASSYADNASYRRVTRRNYGVSSALDSRKYLTVDTVESYATGSGAAATPARVYLDALGRPHYSSTPSGTYEQTAYDALGRVSSLLRYSGAPPSSGPVVSNSWTYDKRGRVLTDFSDSRGYLFYTYLPTGDSVQTIQNPRLDQANVQQSVSSDFYIGSLGRVVERRDARWEKAPDCTWAKKTDDTLFQYDKAFNGPGSQGQAWYGYTAGRLSAVLNSTAAGGAVASIALGYDNLGNAIIRDEWIGASTDLHSVSASVGPDGRLLSKTMTSPYLVGYNSFGRFGYNVAYDSAGNPAQISAFVDATGAGQAIVANDPAAYWTAGQGTGGTDPTTGPFDALGRLSAERLDGGSLSRQHAWSPNSNLPTGFGTTLTGSTNVYTVSQMTWQGTLLLGQTVASNWDGSLGTSHAASYDADGHLETWSATPMGTKGTSSSQFNERFTFKLENLNTVKTTNSLGATVTSTYNYDPASPERVLSTTTGAPVGDFYGYDVRQRGLITQHKLTAAQSPAQDAYEYDSMGRLISIAHLGVVQEQLGYDGAGDLVSRTFAAGGAEAARYYIGDDLTLIDKGTTKLGYAHIRLGNRVASFWASISRSGGSTTPPPGNPAAGTSLIPNPGHPPPVTTTTKSGVVYYHRDRRGDVVATTANGGVMGVSYRYLPSGQLDKVLDANGNPLASGSEDQAVASELGFIGGLKLSGGLIHLKARVYSPLIRRFLQPDTVDFRRYTYSHGDPLNFSDPSGRKGEDAKSTHSDTPEGFHHVATDGMQTYIVNGEGMDAILSGQYAPSQIFPHEQHWEGGDDAWIEIKGGPQTANLNGVNGWISGVSVNDAYIRSMYRMSVAARGTGQRLNIRFDARRGLAVLGKTFSEAIQKPMGTFNPTKTNADVNALAERTGTVGGIGIAIALAGAVDNIQNAQEPFAQMAMEGGMLGGAIAGGELAAGAAAVVIAATGVLTGGLSIAAVMVVGAVGAYIGGNVGAQGAANAYDAWGR